VTAYGRPDARLDTELAGFRLEAVVGRGGMGTVYRAEDLRLGRKVAVKLIAPELAGDERFRERFLRESRIAASLDHPHIVPIHGAGDDDGALYLAMRYVEGTDLAHVIAEHGALDPRRALAVLEQVAEALDAAHERGLVHRDVKPSNILLARAGGKEHAYLSDFGLTKQASSLSGLSVAGQILGTLDYVAPEQIRGEPVDGRADVYALACVLHECLTGTPPFPRATDVAVLWAHVHEPPARARVLRPSLPPAMDDVLSRGLAKDPAGRPATCGELIAAAGAVLEHAVRPVPRSRRLLLVLALVPLFVGAAVAAGLVLGLQRTPSGLAAVSPNAVGVIDPATNELVAQVPVGVLPTSVAAGAGAVWVANVEDQSVSRIDPVSRQVVKTLALHEHPSDLAAGPEGVWVGHAQLARLSRILPDANSVARPVEALGEDATCGGSRASVALGGGMAWLACYSGELGRLDPRTREARGASFEAGLLDSPTGVPPAISDVTFGLDAVWIANEATNSVTPLDPVTGRPLRGEITVGRGARSMAVSPNTIWVAASGEDAVTRVDVAPGTWLVTVTSIALEATPVEVAFGEGALWTANADGTVSRIDPERNEVVATIQVGPRAVGVAVGEGAVWVSVQASEEEQ
jgi:DNA-binding beta-propeller fold protein YncE